MWFFKKKKDKNFISDKDLKAIVSVALSYADKFPDNDPITEDFIMSQNEYHNTTFDNKFGWLMATLGKVIKSERAKADLDIIINNLSLNKQ